MEVLPTEILEQILSCPAIAYMDVLSFAATCTRFRDVGDKNDIWRTKFRRTFRRLYPKILTELTTRGQAMLEWRVELRRRVVTGVTMQREVAAMSPRLFQEAELSTTDLAVFDDMLVGHNPTQSLVPLYMVDSLLEGLEDRKEEQLTEKFYARKVLVHVQQRLMGSTVREVWPVLGGAGCGVQGHEEVLVLVARWCQPTTDLQQSEVSGKLGGIVGKVLAHLLPTHPHIVIFQLSGQQQEDRVEVDLTLPPSIPGELGASMWGDAECLVILDAINHVLYEVEGLQGNADDYYNPHNSFIDRVLETGLGIPISLCLLYTSVARRLGILASPINSPGHFLLRWEARGEGAAAYIDAFERGRRLTYAQARARVPQLVVEERSYLAASPGDCARRMLRNLVSIGASRSSSMRDSSYTLLRSALELMLMVEAADTVQFAFMLSRVYLQLNINQEEVMGLLGPHRDNPGLADQVKYLLKECHRQIEIKEKSKEVPTIRRRAEASSYPHGEVRYRVGQVCTHRKYHYTCVIYGWDAACTASSAWITHMGVDKLEQQDKQPFYNVLVGDGSQRYAAQENLSPLARTCAVPHVDVGRYFTALHPAAGYSPNAELAADYPDDFAA